MEDKENISISVHIAGRSYPLKVKETDADIIKGIADQVNEKVGYFQRTYVNRDKQDCLSMAVLTFAVDYHRLKEKMNSSNISEKVEKLDKMLEDLIQ